jgi:DNA-binding response OmpR family regulator
MLKKKGFQVEIAYNAISGLRKAYQLKPDVVILDVMLPDVANDFHRTIDKDHGRLEIRRH